MRVVALHVAGFRGWPQITLSLPGPVAAQMEAASTSLIISSSVCVERPAMSPEGGGLPRTRLAWGPARRDRTRCDSDACRVAQLG